MDYIGPLGIPYDEWLDWPDLSKQAALAWQARERDRCPDCGQQRSDWFDDDGHEVPDPPSLPAEYVCPSCEALDSYRRDKGEDRRDGAKIVFKPAEVYDQDTDEAASIPGGGDGPW